MIVEVIKYYKTILDSLASDYFNVVADYLEKVLGQLNLTINTITDQITPADDYVSELLSILNAYSLGYQQYSSIDIDYTLDQLVLSITDVINDYANLHLSDSIGNEVSHRDISPAVPSAIQAFTDRISLYINWKYPSLQISSSDVRITNGMMAADPLYLIDWHEKNLNNILSNYTEMYQRRLRPYLVQDKDYSQLPIGQYSCIVSFNFFDYLSLPTIKEHLDQILLLLRPGGIFVFTYSNCEMANSAKLANDRARSWNTYTALSQLAHDMGYKITGNFDVASGDSWCGYISWIEIKRPGALSTIKAHQVLGQINKK